MAETTYEYGKYGVAYLDILGFTPRVKDVGRVQQVAELLDGLETFLSATSTGDLNTHMFSDTIVVTFSDASDLSGYGMTYLSLLQVQLAVRGFFLRGGIAHGDHYEKGRVMFGPAYMDAYELEKLAMWPRVLVHQSILSIDSGRFDWANRTVRDDRGLTFVDYLHNAFMLFVALKWISEYTKQGDIIPRVSSQELLRHHRAAILKAADEGQGDLSVLVKYRGLATYHNSVIHRLVSMLQGWLSIPILADVIEHDPHSRLLFDMFLAGVAPKSEDETADAVKYLFSKTTELLEEHDRLEDAIIDLPATFSALHPA